MQHRQIFWFPFLAVKDNLCQYQIIYWIWRLLRPRRLQMVLFITWVLLFVNCWLHHAATNNMYEQFYSYLLICWDFPKTFLMENFKRNSPYEITYFEIYEMLKIFLEGTWDYFSFSFLELLMSGWWFLFTVLCKIALL